jgi:serine/threonine-protein kinase
MGTVYLAEQRNLQRDVALKVMSADLEVSRESQLRFIREARVQASLDHPHILPVYEAGEDGGRIYIAMKYVRGYDLAYLLSQSGTLNPNFALSILTQVAEALDVTHTRGVIHRDLKPANILVESRTVDAHYLYLADFGLARRVDGPALTRAGVQPGTPAFMAPEQLMGQHVDKRVDVYALACVLYMCVTGNLPYSGSLEQILYGHLYGAIPRLADPSLKPLQPIVNRGLAKRPDDRFSSCGELLSASRDALRRSKTVAQREQTAWSLSTVGKVKYDNWKALLRLTNQELVLEYRDETFERIWINGEVVWKQLLPRTIKTELIVSDGATKRTLRTLRIQSNYRKTKWEIWVDERLVGSFRI